MFTLHKGDCEHCSQTYRYMLLHAGFGEFSYAYCECCGILAAFSYTNKDLQKLPPLSSKNEEIDADWEPFLRSCSCGGRFHKGASPRCIHCNSELSAEYAAGHIERNSVGAARGWHWQRNWSSLYCMVLEDPLNPGTMRQIADPIIRIPKLENRPIKRSWVQLFSLGR
jgi:hypothetical protein